MIYSSIPLMFASVIRAIIFDLDGTLIHSLPGLTSSLNRVLAKNGLDTHPESAVRNFIGNGINKLVERACPEQCSAQKTTDLVEAMSQDYAVTWKQGTAPYPGVTTTLQRLLKQKIAIAVFSNKPHIFCKEITDYLFPDIHFSSVIGQREGIPVKPDPAGAFDVIRDLQTPIDHIAFVGDSTMDLATARNAGLLSVAATWGYHDRAALEAALPDHQIDSIEELLPVINRA